MFEAACLEHVFSYAPRGVLLKSVSHGGIANRQYNRRAYKLSGAFIFIDPPGSSVQEFHIDMQGCDRDAAWNMLIPLEVHGRHHMASSLFSSKGGGSACVGEATMWDACWNHQGLGNTTSRARTFLHLLFLPFWMLVPDVDRQMWMLDDAELVTQISAIARGGKTTQDPWDYIRTIQSSIEREYNRDKRSGAHRLGSAESPLSSWVERVRANLPTIHEM